jgi:hypothetical protein
MFVRQIGFVVLAIAAVIVVAVSGPTEPEPIDTSRFDRQVQQALSDFDANEARTEGAPQQQVVNGWVNRDLLTIISRQLSASMETTDPGPADDRLPYLGPILVLAVAWHGAISPRSVAPVGAAAQPSAEASAAPSARHDEAPVGPRVPDEEHG